MKKKQKGGPFYETPRTLVARASTSGLQNLFTRNY